MAKDLAVVLNSGSINSAVATAIAAQRYRLVLVHADESGGGAMAGGAGGTTRTRVAYDQQVAHFKPYREHTLSMPFLRAPGAASHAAAGASAASAADPRVTAPLGPQVLELLPLIAVAVRFAVQYQASAIYVGLRVGGGASADDLVQATEYVQVWNELIQLPCGQPELEVTAPLLDLEPWQVVDVGYNVAAPFDRTWSCLEEANEPCWACRGCRLREAAFQQAAKPDPLRAVRRV